MTEVVITLMLFYKMMSETQGLENSCLHTRVAKHWKTQLCTLSDDQNANGNLGG